MVANGSYRATRLSGMTSRLAIVLRNTGSFWPADSLPA